MRQLLKYAFFLAGVVLLICGFYFLNQKEKVWVSKENIQNETLISVVHIVDGDTIDVVENTKKKRVRLLGINTPESVDPRRPVECFGNEASAYMETLLENRSVKLEKDPEKPDTDEHGRLLRYVYRDDGIFINEKMIADGYAYEYTYKGETYMYQKLFKAAQREAQTNDRGLWAKGVCGK